MKKRTFTGQFISARERMGSDLPTFRVDIFKVNE